MAEYDYTSNDRYRMNTYGIPFGGIYYVRKGPSTGSEQHSGRPGIIMSDVTAVGGINVVFVVYLTTKAKPNHVTHVPIMSSGRESVALCYQTNSVDISRLGDFMGMVTPAEMTALKKGLAAVMHMQLRSSIPYSPSEEEARERAFLEAQVIALSRMLAEQTAAAKTAMQMYKQLVERILPTKADIEADNLPQTEDSEFPID